MRGQFGTGYERASLFMVGLLISARRSRLDGGVLENALYDIVDATAVVMSICVACIFLHSIAPLCFSILAHLTP